MTPDTLLRLLSPLDAAALAVLALAWAGIGWRIEHPGMGRPSVTVAMAQYRRAWMVEMLARETRIFDAQILASLRQSTAFFASTALFAVGGVLALIGNPGALSDVSRDLTADTAPDLLLRVRLLPVAILLSYAFLKFVWSNRVFGYCAVMMAAVPNDPADPNGPGRAAKAAELNIRAAWNFNRGLRSMYFALAALAWMVGAWALILGTGIIVVLLWTREFASVSRDIVVKEDGS